MQHREPLSGLALPPEAERALESAGVHSMEDLRGLSRHRRHELLEGFGLDLEDLDRRLEITEAADLGDLLAPPPI